MNTPNLPSSLFTSSGWCLTPTGQTPPKAGGHESKWAWSIQVRPQGGEGGAWTWNYRQRVSVYLGGVLIQLNVSKDGRPGI